MLDTPGEVINALKTLTDCYYLKSNFIICPKSNKSDNNCKEPFCNGFLSGADKRFELINRLNTDLHNHFNRHISSCPDNS